MIFFLSGYNEEEVATTIDRVLPSDDPARIGLHASKKNEMIRRVVHRRTAAFAIRPWKGPMPKVSLPNLTVFDLIKPESWTLVHRRKSSRRTRDRKLPEVTAAALPPVTETQIRVIRQERLNSLLGRDSSSLLDGPRGALGPVSTGYEAQLKAQAAPTASSETPTLHGASIHGSATD